MTGRDALKMTFVLHENADPEVQAIEICLEAIFKLLVNDSPRAWIRVVDYLSARVRAEAMGDDG